MSTKNELPQWMKDANRKNQTPPKGGVNYADGSSYNPPATSTVVEENPLGDLATANAVGTIITAIGDAYVSYENAKTAKVVAEYQAQIQANNARMAELSALSALNQSQWKIAAITMRAGKVKSGQKVAMAANGIKVGVGSSAELLASTDIMKRIDVNTEYANGYRAAWGYRSNATQANMKSTALSATAIGTNAALSGSATLSAGLLTAFKNYQKDIK